MRAFNLQVSVPGFQADHATALARIAAKEWAASTKLPLATLVVGSGTDILDEAAHRGPLKQRIVVIGSSHLEDYRKTLDAVEQLAKLMASKIRGPLEVRYAIGTCVREDLRNREGVAPTASAAQAA